MSRTMPGDLGKCSSYIRYEVRDNKISCNMYETKTISGDLISEKKTNNNEKGFDVKVLTRRVHVLVTTKRTVAAVRGTDATYSK